MVYALALLLIRGRKTFDEIPDKDFNGSSLREQVTVQLEAFVASGRITQDECDKILGRVKKTKAKKTEE